MKNRLEQRSTRFRDKTLKTALIYNVFKYCEFISSVFQNFCGYLQKSFAPPSQGIKRYYIFIVFHKIINIYYFQKLLFQKCIKKKHTKPFSQALKAVYEKFNYSTFGHLSLFSSLSYMEEYLNRRYRMQKHAMAYISSSPGGISEF